MSGERAASFGQVLRQLRSAAALSQADLAERAGLSERGISDLERERRQVPRPETARLLADALELNDDARAELLAAARPTVLREKAPEPISSGAMPVPLTRLIGREPEIASMLAMLIRDAARLVTVTGVGGSGKTRLALEVAVRLRSRFADGVAFVDLSPLADPALVLPSIAAALSVRDSVGQPLGDSLARFLAPRQTLLLLDNCERVLGAVPALNALLTASPGLTILATSREPLRVRGEREFPLSPLPLPAPDAPASVAELARIPAIALFIERAEASQPTFRLTAENATAVAATCGRLDGLPLAIELAAVRVKVLPPAALLARLEKRLPLLTGGRDLPARQQTMRDAIAWSYDLLAPSEQALFRRMAIFAGGFTLTAAEAVADPGTATTVFDGVAALAEQSLLQQSSGTGEEPRYQMLETVREFGLERLAAAGETDEARQRHAAFFLQQSADFMTGSPILLDRERLARVVAEQDNVRLALEWFDGHGEEDAALLQLSAMLDGLWFARGLYGEGLQWAERALERSSPTASAPRVRALDGAAMLAILQGDYARAERFLDEGRRLAEALADPVLIGEALANAGFLSYRQGNYGQAERQLEMGLRGIAESNYSGFALLILGDAELAQEQFDRAASAYQGAIARFRQTGYAWGLSDAQAGLAGVHLCTGNLARALAGYSESFERVWRLGFPMYVASALFGIAGVAAAADRAMEGAQLLGAGESMIATLGAPMFPRDRPIRERGLTALRAMLGDEALAAARAAGQRLSLADVATMATAMAEAVPTAPAEPSERAMDRAGAPLHK